MSVVSGVTVFVSVIESETDDGDDIAVMLDGWLEAVGAVGRFSELSEAYGGGKHPQQFVHGGGFKYFDEDGFAARFNAHRWESAENAVLVIQPEDGTTRVWAGTRCIQNQFTRPGRDASSESRSRAEANDVAARATVANKRLSDLPYDDFGNLFAASAPRSQGRDDAW